MTQDQFTDAVMEELFVRGFVCPPRAAVAVFVRTDWQRFGPLTDPAACIESLSRVPDLLSQATMLGFPASASGCARNGWLCTKRPTRSSS